MYAIICITTEEVVSCIRGRQGSLKEVEIEYTVMEKQGETEVQGLNGEADERDG